VHVIMRDSEADDVEAVLRHRPSEVS
jgi:hypothetical protein